MTIDELNFEYNDFCNKYKVCTDCKYNENFPCQMMFGYDKGKADTIEEELQEFAQWLWDSHYLIDEAFTIRLVEQYKAEQLQDKKKSTCFDCKNHFMSDCYLECHVKDRINNDNICDNFQQLKEQENG